MKLQDCLITRLLVVWLVMASTLSASNGGQSDVSFAQSDKSPKIGPTAESRELLPNLDAGLNMPNRPEFNCAEQSPTNQIADRFDYPMPFPEYQGFTNALQTFGIENQVFSGRNHAGEDWQRLLPSGQLDGLTTVNASVFSIARGKVFFADNSANYEGGVVIIQHRLSDGLTVYSLYGHINVNATLTVGTEIGRGTEIGKVKSWEGQGGVGNSHLHFEIRKFYCERTINGADAPKDKNYPPGPGYWYIPTSPLVVGWLNPSEFIERNRPQSVMLYDNRSYNDPINGSYTYVNIGVYDLPPTWENRASSIYLPPGYSVKAYEFQGRAGRSKTLTSSAINFDGITFDGGISSLSLDNQISSIEVFRYVCPGLNVSTGQSVDSVFEPSSVDCLTPTPPPPTNPTPTPIPTAVPPPTYSGLQLEVLQGPPSLVTPGQSFNVRVRVNVLSGQLRGVETRGDMLRAIDGNQYQATPHQAVYGTINAGQNFVFGDRDVFTLVAPSAPGIYTSRWRMWVAGAWVGPELAISFNVGSAPPPPPRPSGWRVQYWNGYYNDNPWSNGRCRTDEYTDSIPFTKYWGNNGPGGGCSASIFSVLFERKFVMKAGQHRFHCHRDSYCRIFIIGQGNGQGEDGGTYGGMDWTVNIPSDGEYEVKVEYSHRSSNGPSQIEFWWQGNGEDYLPPFSWNDDACNAQPYQWCGRYRLTRDSAGDSVPWRKFDGIGFLDKSWDGSPGYGISNDFAAAWKRKLNVPAGLYRFYMDHDDGARLSVNNQRVIDQWGTCCQTHTADVWLNSGDNQLDVDWFDGGGSAVIKVRWEPLQLCSSLNLAALPSSGGTISVSTAPNCDNATKYRPDTTVNLTANPSANGTFAGWGGDATGTNSTVSVLMNASKTVNAYFDVCYTLTTSVSLTGAGSITTNPAPNCGGNKYRNGTNINILTVPNSGYGFINWTGAVTGSFNPQLVTMNGNVDLIANYVKHDSSFSGITPLPPYCVIANTTYAPDRVLELTGSGFSSTKHSLQFQWVSDGRVTNPIAGEVDWVSATQIKVDFDRIKTMFDVVNGTALMRVRVTANTSNGLIPSSEWSTPFVLANTEAACGLTRQPTATPIVPTPVPTQTVTPTPTLTLTPTTTPSCSNCGPANTQWPIYQHDNAHTGRGTSAGPSSPRTKWSRSINSFMISSAVIGTGNLVYFTEGEKLFALNISDGQALWSFTADGNLRSPALADNGRLYVISDAGTLYCFTESGTKLWSVKHTNQWTGQGLTIGTDGTFYFGASDGWLYAINSDSSLKWKYQVGSWINGVPALDSQGNIYFGSTTHSVYALRPNGTLIWSFTTDDFVDASPSIDEGRNTVYVGSVGGTLFALNRLTGVKRWEFKTGGALYRAAAIGSDGRVYLGSINGIFYAISNNGTQIWSVALDGPVHGLPSIDTDGTIYVGTEGGSVYAINSDGSIRWQHTIGGLVNFGTVIANSIIYASSTSGFVAIENAASPTPGATVTLTPTVTVTTTPGITPTPITPTPIKTPSTTSSPTVVNLDQCTVSIENGKAFTKRRDITIKSNMSTATEMQVSNDGGFAGATWQPFRVNLSWTLGDPGVRIASLFVYVRFRNANGLLCNGNNLIDDVVYDPLPPKVLGVVVRNDQSDHSLFATVSQEAEGVRLRIIATDQLGGSEVDVMQISSRADFADSVWEPYMTEKSIAMQANAKLYVRVRDGAENVSESVVVSSSDMRFVFLPVVTK